MMKGKSSRAKRYALNPEGRTLAVDRSSTNERGSGVTGGLRAVGIILIYPIGGVWALV